jgi:hypothetical protein
LGEVVGVADIPGFGGTAVVFGLTVGREVAILMQKRNERYPDGYWKTNGKVSSWVKLKTSSWVKLKTSSWVKLKTSSRLRKTVMRDNGFRIQPCATTQPPL